jgi:hypothetical protein
MDFTVEPMEDILEREHREFVERRRAQGAKRMSADTLARLAAPKAQAGRRGAKGGDAENKDEPKAITHDDDGWGVWDDAIDVPPPEGGAAAAEPGPSPTADVGANGDSPSAAPPSPEKRQPRQPYRKVSGRGLALDSFYVLVQGAGREAAFALDRKTMFAAALEATNYPRGGCLVYRGLPVHNHATAVTLGLRQGPDHVTLLLFMSREELAEETARRGLMAEETAAWGNCLAALVVALEDARKPARRHFADADAAGTFIDTDGVSA